MKRVSLGPMLLVLLAVLAVACTDADVTGPPGASSLAGSGWRAITVSGAAPVAGREPTLLFADGAQVNGNTGCNSFFGGYAYAEGRITFRNVGMTLMGCDDAVGSVEAAFTKALNAATSASIDDGGRLLLSGPGGEILLAPLPPGESGG
jgi:heat shock protein HslJ